MPAKGPLNLGDQTFMRHDGLWGVPVDGRPGGNELLKQRVTRDDAAIDGPLVLPGDGNRDGFLRPLRLGGNRGQHPSPDAVVGLRCINLERARRTQPELIA
jgi:hypothetical protein